jgi:hypothetical protein
MINTYRYVSVEDVYRTSGLREAVIGRYDVERQVERAEVFVCRYTKNIYYKYNLEDEPVDAATDNTVTVATEKWAVNDWKDQYITITSGTGSGQYRKIISNTKDTLTLDRDFDENPDATSSFSIFYVPKAFSPYQDKTDVDALNGSREQFYYLPFYPVTNIESLEVDDVVVDPADLYIFKQTGKIGFRDTASVSRFGGDKPMCIEIKYWYGVPVMTDDVKRLIELKASIQILGQQMGGTFDVPSTFSLPDLNVSIGQAYINIRGTIDVLQREYDELLKTVKIYPVVA